MAGYDPIQISPTFEFTKPVPRLFVPPSAITPPQRCPPEQYHKNGKCVTVPGVSVPGPFEGAVGPAVMGGAAGVALSGTDAGLSAKTIFTNMLMAVALNAGAGYLVARQANTDVPVTVVASAILGVFGMAGGVYFTKRKGRSS